MTSHDHYTVYEQRYETFRHLDRLRWQMVQIASGAGAVSITFLDGDSNGPLWAFAAVGALLLTLAIAMERIRAGIVANTKPLKRAGEQIGDVDIPIPKAAVKTYSFWMAIALFLLGAALIGIFTVDLFCTSRGS